MDLNNQDMEKVAQIANKMKGKSEDEVVSELANLVMSGEAGISAEKVRQMISMISPMLNNDQKRKLEKLEKQLKK